MILRCIFCVLTASLIAFVVLSLNGCSSDKETPVQWNGPSLEATSKDCAKLAKKLNLTYYLDTNTVDGFKRYECNFKYSDDKGGFALSGQSTRDAIYVLNVQKSLPNRPAFVACFTKNKCSTLEHIGPKVDCFEKCGTATGYSFRYSDD